MANTKDDTSLLALLYYTDLMFGVQLNKMAQKAGFSYLVVRPGTTPLEGDVLIVDLGARGDWEGVIRQANERGIPVIAFGPHMDAEGRRKAKQAGAQRVLTNSNLARDLPIILRELKSDGGQKTVDDRRSMTDD